MPPPGDEQRPLDELERARRREEYRARISAAWRSMTPEQQRVFMEGFLSAEGRDLRGLS